PGIDFSKLEVSIDKGLLTIAGERATGLPQEGDKLSVYARERYAGTFKRVVSLPDDVDTARVEANYRDGILRISIPKAEASKPRPGCFEDRGEHEERRADARRPQGGAGEAAPDPGQDRVAGRSMPARAA